MTGTRPAIASVKMPCRCSSVGTVDVTVRADRLTLSLVIDEEEGVVLDDRAAERAAELVAPVLRLRRVRRLKVVPRVQRLVAEELEPVAVKRVARPPWSSG